MKLSPATWDRLREDARPIAADLNRLAGKYGVTPATIAKHALLLPVPLPNMPEWNQRIAGQS